MSKDDAIEIYGTVIEALPNALFKVKLENGYIILAYISGKMRINNIKIIPGDKVKLEMSQYDLTKGRIIRREKLDSNKSTGGDTTVQNNYSDANMGESTNSGLNQDVTMDSVKQEHKNYAQ